MLQDQHASRQN
jgi:hypothetical protein